MSTEPVPDPSTLKQSIQDEALKKIESGEQALDHETGADARSTLPPASESGQQPGEQ